MSAPEVASASVALLPTFKGGAAAIEKALGPGLGRAGSTAGTSYGSAFSSGLLSSLPIGKLGGLAAISDTLFAGFTRFSAIDSARGKLTALGFDATEVAADLDSAKTAVLGTQFALNEATTSAASAIASGVQQGKALTDYLTLVADVAAITGSALGDVSMVFNQITSAGRLYTQDANQLVARGIPVYKLLADQYGVTATALREMVSEGKIDSETFFQTIQRTYGGAAKNVDTLQSSFSNFRAGVGRTGEKLLEPTLLQGSDALKDLTNSLDAAAPSLEAIGEGLGEMVGFARSIPGPMQGALVSVLAFVAARKPLAALNASILDGDGKIRGYAQSAKLLAGGWSGTSVQLSTVAQRVAGTTTSIAALSKTASTSRVFVAGLGGEITATSGKLVTFSAAARSARTAIVGAFGGPVGFGVTVAITAITAGLSAWTAATEAQKQAVKDLTQTLDANSGAVTLATRRTIFDNLNPTDGKSVTESVEKLGLSTKEYLDAIIAGGPAQDAYRARLQAIYDAANKVNTSGTLVRPDDLAALQSAKVALEGFDQQVTNLGNSRDAFTAAERAGVEATNADGNAAATAAGQFGSLEDSIKGAFSRVNALTGQQAALDELYGSIAKNGRVINSTTRGGLANAQALEGAISALATSAAGDSAVFAGSVIGLMESLRKQGVDTTGVMGTVRNALGAIAGTKWTVLLDGRQSIAEAKQIIKANIAAAKSAALIGDPSDRSKYNYVIAQYSKQLAELNKVAAAANSATSTYTGATKAYSAATGSAVSATKKTDPRLAAIAKKRKALAKQITAANNALKEAIALRDDFKKSITDGFASLGSLTKLAEVSEDTVMVYTRVGDTIFAESKKQSLSSSSIIANLRDQLAEAAKFQKAFKDLTALGLNKDSLQDLVSSFASTGDASIADALLAGGKEAVDQVNDLEKQLADIGESIGTDSSKALYQAGVDTAQGFLDGLKSKDKKLLEAYKSIAKTLVSTIEKELGIHSPSRETAYLAQMASAGWNNNLKFDAVTPGIGVDGSFPEFPTGQPIFLQQNITYEREQTADERLNDALDLAKVGQSV